MAAAQQQPPKRRRRGFEPAGKLLASDLRGPAERRGFAEARLLTHWPDIVGAAVADIALPVKITHGRGFGGTLVLLTTGANAPVLDMQKTAIVEKVNACYGYRAISRIQVTQTAPRGFAEGQIAFDTANRPARAPEPDPARLAKAREGLDTIEDDTLRDALATLARNIVTRTHP